MKAEPVKLAKNFSKLAAKKDKALLCDEMRAFSILALSMKL